MTSNLLISVVTVSYNAASTIEQTILSIINQTYKNIEYIIIDGGSTDDTVNIIRKYADRIAYWVSEPDKGIYDAMNKGIDAATGEWVNYMNAGDVFIDNSVVSNLFQNSIADNYGIVFGNTLFLKGDKQIVVRYGDDCPHKIMPSCHQSIFCRRSLLIKYPFDLKYKIAADYNFFYQLSKTDVGRKYVDIVVSAYDALDGISSRNEWTTRKEMLKIENQTVLFYIKSSILCAKLVVKRILIMLRVRK